MKWLIVIVGIACNASASVLVKVAVMPPRHTLLFKQPLSILANVPLVAGLVPYGASFVLYAAALTMLPLNVAYPVLTSGAIATVAAVSVLVFGEPMPWTTIVGILLVIIGVIFIAARVACGSDYGAGLCPERSTMKKSPSPILRPEERS